MQLDGDRVRFNDGKLEIQLRTPTSPEKMLENMEHNLARGLRPVPICKAHGQTMAIAAGGPSLSDTWQDLEGHVAAGNGSLGYLIERGMVPHFCNVLDALPHMADIVVADPRVNYLIASNCDPGLFDKLLDAGCRVWIWNPTPENVGIPLSQDAPFHIDPEGKGFHLLGKHYPDQHMIGGGTSVGLRLIFIGYTLGYRTFHLHGNDASFKDRETHAYWDRRWGEWVDHSSIEICGYRTSLNFLQHVTSCANIMAILRPPRFESVNFKVFGDGLIQSCMRYWLANRAAMSPQEAFQRNDASVPYAGPIEHNTNPAAPYVWPEGDKEGWRITLNCEQLLQDILEHTEGRDLIVQAGGNVGVLPALLAPHFETVVTFEPDKANLDLMASNAPHDNIIKYYAALGETPSGISLARDPANCGAHYVDGHGDINVIRLDELGLSLCDAIVLDVEGYELFALMGAAQTIARHKPLIIFEENGQGNRYGVEKGAIAAWLSREYGYVEVARSGRDIIMRAP